MSTSTKSGDGFIGAAGVDDGAVEGGVPIEIVGAQRADGADDASVGVLEDGGKTGDASLCDGLKNYGSVGEAGLGAGTVGAVGDLDAVGGAGIESGVSDF